MLAVLVVLFTAASITEAAGVPEEQTEGRRIVTRSGFAVIVTSQVEGLDSGELQQEVHDLTLGLVQFVGCLQYTFLRSICRRNTAEQWEATIEAASEWYQTELELQGQNTFVNSRRRDYDQLIKLVVDRILFKDAPLVDM